MGHIARLFHAIALPGATALVILVVWEGAARAGWVPHFVLPAPTAIVEELVKSWRMLALHAYVTTIEVILGFLLALVAGAGLAILMVYIRVVERAVYPWVVVLQVIPKIALGPLFVIW